MKVLVSDYGLNVWYGNIYDYENRLSMLKELGYDGIERLHAATEAEAIYISVLAKKMGMEFATCESINPSQSILWSAALGKEYVWIENETSAFDVMCRHAQAHISGAKKYGITASLHNHLGKTVETQQQLEEFLKKCPDSGIILDIGHLVGAGGDPIEIIEKYFDRIVMVHLKDFVIIADDPKLLWHQRIRFCGLGEGVLGELTGRVIRLLADKGYDGYIAVEHDTHLQNPKLDLKSSREFIRKYGV